MGVKSVKKHQIYIRFVRKSDKKIKGAEARSKYYVKYGNPNYGNMKGLLTNSMRSKLKAKQIRDASSDLVEDKEEEEAVGRRPIAYDIGYFQKGSMSITHVFSRNVTYKKHKKRN